MRLHAETTSGSRRQRVFAVRRTAPVALTACGLAAAALLIAWQAEPASAEVAFCPPGSGAGQCQNAQGVAADTEAERVYVADSGNNRVNVFEADGDFLFAFGWGVATGVAQPETCTLASGCQAGVAGPGAGQMTGSRRIAVDNTGGPEQGSVYVGSDQARVQKFDPTGDFELMFGKGVNTGTGDPDICTDAGAPTDICGAGTSGSALCQVGSSSAQISVGSAGDIYLADTASIGANFKNRMLRFATSGACLGEVNLFEGLLLLQAGAVDTDQNLYVSVNGAGNALRKYDASGSFLYGMDEQFGTVSLSLDELNNVLVSQAQSKDEAAGTTRVLTQYSPSGQHLRRFGYSKFSSTITGVAPLESAFGDVLAVNGQGVRYLEFPPPGPIAAPESLAVSDLGNVRATLMAEVNPEGEPTEYRFDYVDEESFETEGGFASPNTVSTPTVPVGGAADFELHTVKAQIGCEDAVTEAESGECLIPDTTYRFRVVATNGEGPGEGEAAGPAFTTKEPLEILATYATEAGTDAARLNAEVNPLGIPASGFFEYVDEATYEQSGFDEALRAPADDDLDFGASEGPVTRSSTIAPLEPGTAYRYRVVADNPLIEPVIGPERALVTFEPDLPDPCPANEAFRAGPSALLPDCRAYEMVSPLDKENGDTIVLLNPPGLPATLDQSSHSGEKLTYGTYRAFGAAESAPYTSQYVAEREAGTGWANHGVAPPRERLVLENLSMLDTEFKAFSPDLCQAWHRTVAEPVLAPGGVAGYPNLYRRTDQAQGCGGKSYEAISAAAPLNVGPNAYFPEYQGSAATGSLAIFVAPDNLVGGMPPQPASCISEELGCLQRLYGKLADQPPAYLCILPNGESWNNACSAGTGLAGKGGGENRQSNVANAISADGSRVYWTDAASGPGRIYLRLPGAGQTLAVSEAAEGLSGTSSSQYWWAAADGSRAIFTTGGDLYEFQPVGEQTTLLAEGVSGVMGASEDASRVYFASSQVLDPESAEGRAPVAGQANLYLAAAGEIEFIMTLAAVDANTDPAVSVSPISVGPFARTSRVSPDGLHAAWMSAAAPTGYDNRDAKSGEPDAEVFRYDAGSGELVCASCNPSGARPAGRDIAPEGASEYWAAASIPPWASSLYASRVLADDGSRLYFESTDALVLRDTNGTTDVYQWEEAGAGSCDAGDPTYSDAARGCVDLISSGQSARASEFVDASASGEDVFFATLQSMVSQDYGLVDIYDARVDGGLPSPPSPPAQCEGEACQNPAPAPARAPFSSAIYAGPGDLRSGPFGQRRCQASARRAKRLARRAKLLRRAARSSSGPTAKRRRLAASRRKARQARKLTRDTRRCRAGNRNRGRSGR